MISLTEPRVRSCFVNLTKGEAGRMNVPRSLADVSWTDLDYLGWRDPKSPARGYLVAEVAGVVRGVALRAPDPTAGAGRKNLCSLCLTPHTGGGVGLMVASRAGRAGQQGHSVGTYICADLACSLYVRHLRETGTPRMHETLTVEQKVDRLVVGLEAFVARVMRPR